MFCYWNVNAKNYTWLSKVNGTLKFNYTYNQRKLSKSELANSDKKYIFRPQLNALTEFCLKTEFCVWNREAATIILHKKLI